MRIASTIGAKQRPFGHQPGGHPYCEFCRLYGSDWPHRERACSVGFAKRHMRARHRRPVMYSAGLDAHLKYVSVAVLDRMGKVALETTVFHAAGDRTFGPFGRNVLSRL